MKDTAANSRRGKTIYVSFVAMLLRSLCKVCANTHTIELPLCLTHEADDLIEA